jgi:hypothetical protein
MKKKEKIPVNGNVNPYDKREVKSAKKAMASTNKSVKPVAKDTNKTRRKETKERIAGPLSNVKKPRVGSPVPRKSKKGE